MRSKKTLGYLIKVLIVLLALFFLYKQLISKGDVISNDINKIHVNIRENFPTILLVVLMMFVNWFLEALKWRALIYKIEKISLIQSIKAVFAGITISSFTPNRVGEYAGRVFCIQKADKVKAVLITVIGSMAQLITTIVFGLLGFLLLPNLMPNFKILLSDFVFSYPLMVFVVILLIVLLITLFLNASVFSVILSKFKFLNKYSKYNEIFSYYSYSDLLETLLYSIARYFVFTTQFFILLHVFEVNVSYIEFLILTTTMLFVISIIPTIAIAEISTRSSVALFLFTLVSNNITGILSATFVMWFINLVLPALIGIGVILTLNFFRNK
jgi:uncharacterized membrane protein YbhN (UPF0104 family)